MKQPEEGDIHTYERTFTKEDVRQFAEVSEDKQDIHTKPDSEGRLMAHGLLTATLPTKIGGELSVLARTMEFEFIKPVYTGDTIECEWRNDEVDELDDRFNVLASVTCRKKDGTEVMRATIRGIIWK